MTIKQATEWYEGLSDDARMKIQRDFGNDGVPDRETKLYRWIKSLKKSEQKEYESFKTLDFEEYYGKFWVNVKNSVDEDGWVYVKEIPHILDAYYESQTGQPIEFQKSFGASGENPNWETRGSRWRPKVISDKFGNNKKI